jgi:gliding motility-associated-like protein
VEYTIVLRNGGSKPASNVTLSFSLSSQLCLVDPDGSQLDMLLENEFIPTSYERTFTRRVRPLSNSSSGVQHAVTLASIDDEVYRQMHLDTLRNTSTINLFSILDSWNIMEAFSPNGDGKNDKFYLRDLHETNFVESAEIVIVNRMGSEVYRHKNYKEAQDDESQAFTAKGLPEGTYFYRLTVDFNDGSPTATRGGFIAVRRSKWE